MTDEQKCASCSDATCEHNGDDSTEEGKAVMERRVLRSRMGAIKHKLIVLSGKGGVGKSTVAANLAASLVLAGKKVGLLDIDIHGPSIPKLLNIESSHVEAGDGALIPPEAFNGLKVMSIGLLVREKNAAVVWRGPMKHNTIKQFLAHVEWGELDYLVVDSPPGTGDEPLSAVQLIDDPDGAVIVSTPQEVAVQDVKRSIMFCRQMALPVLGVVENMSGLRCPECGTMVDVFGSGGAEKMAVEMKVPFLGRIPLDHEMMQSGDDGKPFVLKHVHSETSRAFGRIVRPLLELDLTPVRSESELGAGRAIKVAIPVTGGVLSAHFGHCDQFALFEIDAESRTIRNREFRTPPAHEPGVLPRWLHEQKADVVITTGMGARAQSLFAEKGIEVIIGTSDVEPEAVVHAYLDGSLETGANICDH